MKVLAFDLGGDFAHFRKFYTTSSPLTFSFPPPPTILGILGAIYGTDKNENGHLKAFGYSQIGLRILNPIKKVRYGLNLLETRGKNLKLPMSDRNYQPRTQIRTEFLKDSRYRIFVYIKDEMVLNSLIDKVKAHESVYTVSLGLSELLANFEYVNIFEGIEVNQAENDAPVDVSTPLAMNNLHPEGIIIEEGKKYYKEKLPIKMNNKRIVEIYDEVIFEPDGKTIKAKVKKYCRLENGENITFF